jgi:hypothetical protein
LILHLTNLQLGDFHRLTGLQLGCFGGVPGGCLGIGHDRLRPDLGVVHGLVRDPLCRHEGTGDGLRVGSVDRGAVSKALWLWWHGPGRPDLDQLWRAYIRRFGLEHTLRFVKQTPGLDHPAGAPP